MHEEDGKLENGEGERRREKLDAKKGKKKKKKIGKESPEVKVEKRASMQALSYQTIALNFAGISA